MKHEHYEHTIFALFLLLYTCWLFCYSSGSKTVFFSYQFFSQILAQFLKNISNTNLGFILGKVFDAWRWVVGISVSACLITVGSIVTAVICYKKGNI